MRTAELVARLASQPVPVDPARVRGGFGGLLAAAGLLVVALVLLLSGGAPGLGERAVLPAFWIKLGYPAALALLLAAVLWRLGHPGMRLGLLPWVVPVVLALMVLEGAAVLLAAAPAERPLLLLGRPSWAGCIAGIAALSLPAGAFAVWALRRLAPTRPRLAGAACGLFAGAAAAAAYALYCPELQLPFVAAWYTLGMLLPTAAGAVAGPRLLRW